MKRKAKAENLHGKIADLQRRLEESEETLRAIRNGEVDTLVVRSPKGDEIFELKEAEYLYRVFVDTMNEGAATLTPQGTILYCNNRFAEMLQTSTQMVVGSSIYQFIPPEDESVFASAVRKSKINTNEMDLSLKRGDQGLVPVHISLNALCGQDPQTICMVAMDLTERKRAEGRISIYQRQLRALASELSLAEERERRRLAGELHDHIGQTLALAKIKLSGLLQSANHPDIVPPVAEIKEMLESAIQYTHSLIFEISPPVL